MNVGPPYPNKFGSLINRGRGGGQTNLDPRFLLNSIGGIRIGWVIDRKGFGKFHKSLRRSSEGFSFQGFEKS